MEGLHKNQKISFISREVFKNGPHKIHFIEDEIYHTLYSLGFRFVCIDRKPFIFKLEEGAKVRLVRHFQELRDAFVNYISQLNLPTNEIDEILNAFYAKRPIKRNGLIEHYLTDTTEPGQYLIEELKRQNENL